MEARPDDRLSTVVTWSSHYPIKTVEIVSNGRVAARESFDEGSTQGQLEAEVVVRSDGWIAARLGSDVRNSFAQPIFAHTSPVYVTTGVGGPEKRTAAQQLDDAIETSLEWVRAKGRFYNDGQRQEVVDLFRQGQEVYRKMLE